MLSALLRSSPDFSLLNFIPCARPQKPCSDFRDHSGSEKPCDPSDFSIEDGVEASGDKQQRNDKTHQSPPRLPDCVSTCPLQSEDVLVERVTQKQKDA